MEKRVQMNLDTSRDVELIDKKGREKASEKKTEKTTEKATEKATARELKEK